MRLSSSYGSALSSFNEMEIQDYNANTMTGCALIETTVEGRSGL